MQNRLQLHQIFMEDLGLQPERPPELPAENIRQRRKLKERIRSNTLASRIIRSYLTSTETRKQRAQEKLEKKRRLGASAMFKRNERKK